MAQEEVGGKEGRKNKEKWKKTTSLHARATLEGGGKFNRS